MRNGSRDVNAAATSPYPRKWLRGQDLHLRLEVMSLSYCPTLLPRHKSVDAKHKKWSGWQELNLRGHVPKTCGWPLPYTRIWLSQIREGLAALSCLALHAHHLAQCVYHID